MLFTRHFHTTIHDSGFTDLSYIVIGLDHSLSCIHILIVLFFQASKFNPALVFPIFYQHGQAVKIEISETRDS